MVLRLTNGNCYAACSAARAAKNCSRAYALCAILSPPQLEQGVFASQNPITCPNRQLPGTLDEIKIELIGKILTLFIKYE